MKRNLLGIGAAVGMAALFVGCASDVSELSESDRAAGAEVGVVSKTSPKRQAEAQKQLEDASTNVVQEPAGAQPGQ
jgi:hypothetical protein